jgi:hypothetical protein
VEQNEGIESGGCVYRVARAAACDSPRFLALSRWPSSTGLSAFCAMTALSTKSTGEEEHAGWAMGGILNLIRTEVRALELEQLLEHALCSTTT